MQRTDDAGECEDAGERVNGYQDSLSLIDENHVMICNRKVRQKVIIAACLNPSLVRICNADSPASRLQRDFKLLISFPPVFSIFQSPAVALWRLRG